MTYGAVFEFQMDNMQGAAADNAGVSMDEAYGFVAFPNLGRLYFGQEDAAASLLIVRAPSVGALGGDAEWDEFIVNSGLYSSPYLTSGIADGNDATKIGYLSPQFAGFDFGISYAPNAGEGERVELSNGTPQRERTTREHEISAAVRYRGTFGPVGVQVGVGGLWAKAQRTITNTTLPRPQDINAYFVGAQVAAYGFAFGGEFGFGSYNGSSMGTTALNPGLDDSWHYLIGATYTMGPVMFGAIFGQAEQDNGWGLVNKVLQELPDRRHTVWGLGAVYRLAPGLEVFAAYNNIHDKNIPMAAPSDARYSGFSGTALASFNGQYTRTINIGIAGIRLAF
jgi:predicted porin